MNTCNWFFACLLIFVAFFSPQKLQAQEPEEENFTVQLYLPTIQAALTAPSQPGTGEGAWYQGIKIHTEFYDFLPHYTVEIGIPDKDSYTCQEIVMWNAIQRQYQTVEGGHWRNYPEFPELWGPEFYQLTKTWVGSHLLEALRAFNYWAWCTPLGK